MDQYIHRLLGGRYEVIDVVGVGGMAVVYRARDSVLNRYVAVKILKEEFAKDPDIRKRFSIESQAVAKLSHHNIVSVYDVGSDGGTDYIVMELIEGITLKEYLRQKGHLSWTESLFFAQQICRALMHAHSRGVIHQDIKPQNIIILRDGTAKLTDFGIASFATTQETRVVQEAIGSVHYISPEQAKGFKIDYRTDIYSLGVVMYEMLTGKLPFEGETALQVVMKHLNAVPASPSQLQPGIPAGMDDIVMHAMSASAGRRYASAEALLADLEQLKNDAGAHFYYGGTGAEAGGAQRILEEEPEKKEPEIRRSRREYEPEPESIFDRLAERPGLAAGIAVAVFAVIALLVTGVLLFTGGSGGEKISVPALVGRSIEEVMADADVTDNFTVQEADKRVESSRPVGEILEQTPGTGEKAAKGTVITVTVSAGGDNVEDTYKVVDFTGKTLEYVQSALAGKGLTIRTAEEASDEIEKDRVTRTEPAAGEELEKGATLTIYISTGKEEKQAEVPSLYGLTESGARSALENRNLSIGSVAHIASDAEEGTVIWQSIEEGTQVSEGTEVNIQLSKGRSDSGSGGQDAPTGGDNSGDSGSGGDTSSEPETGYASISVPLPSNTDMAHVVISVDGDVKYDQTLDTGAGIATLTIPGTVGQHEVTISIDGSTTTSSYTFER